jgi:apolipoprotein N-acyltransferase
MTTVTRSEIRDVVQVSGIARIGVGIALSVLSGVVLLLGFQPYGIWPLMWVGYIPMLVAQYRLMPRRWSSLAPAIADLVFLGPLLWGIFGPYAEPWFLGYLGVLIAVIGVFARKERGFHERTGFRWFVPQGVLLVVGFEMIRSFIPFLGTMGFLANSQASQPWLTLPISVFSIYGLSLMVMLTNFTLALGALALFDRKWQWADTVPVPSRAWGRWLAGLGAAVVIWVAVGLAILGSSPKDAPTVRVAALQSNLAIPAQFDEGSQADRVQVLVEQAREAARQGAQLIVTAEMFLGFDPQVEYTDELKALAAETNAYLFLSYAYYAGDEYHNEAVLLSPSGEFGEIYGKNHPAGEPSIVSAGRYPVYDTDLGRLATMICMDTNFTDSARNLARQGAQLIAAPAFDSTPGIAHHMWTHAVMRAVENRVAVVKVGHRYGSAIIDPVGRVVNNKTTVDGERLVLVDDVPLGTGRTLLAHVGDWLGWICLAGFISFVVFQTVTEKRAKKAAQV